MEEEQVRQDYDEDARIMEERAPRIEDVASLVQYHSTPTRIKDSNYHRFLAKELAIGQLKDDNDVHLIMKKFNLITLFTFLGLHEIAKIYHAELLVKINSMRSIDGFERRLQTTVTHQIKKETIDPNQKKGLFGGR